MKVANILEPMPVKFTFDLSHFPIFLIDTTKVEPSIYIVLGRGDMAPIGIVLKDFEDALKSIAIIQQTTKTPLLIDETAQIELANLYAKRGKEINPFLLDGEEMKVIDILAVDIFKANLSFLGYTQTHNVEVSRKH